MPPAGGSPRPAPRPTPPVYGPQPPPPPGTNPWQMPGFPTPPPQPTYDPGPFERGPSYYVPGAAPVPNFAAPPPQTSGGYEAPAYPEGPGGNHWDPNRGPFGEWVDAWGNTIPHMNYGYNDQGQPDLPQYGGPEPAPAAPAAPAPGVPTPPPTGPATFYAPTTGSPYLQLPGNWLGMIDPVLRAQLHDQLVGSGFQSTGQLGTYGESTYLRPPEFNDNDLASLVTNDNIRNWLRFFLGNYGYGISYQLPASYAGGEPPAPPTPSFPAPPGPELPPIRPPGSLEG